MWTVCIYLRHLKRFSALASQRSDSCLTWHITLYESSSSSSNSSSSSSSSSSSNSSICHCMMNKDRGVAVGVRVVGRGSASDSDTGVAVVRRRPRRQRRRYAMRSDRRPGAERDVAQRRPPARRRRVASGDDRSRRSAPCHQPPGPSWRRRLHVPLQELRGAGVSRHPARRRRYGDSPPSFLHCHPVISLATPIRIRICFFLQQAE